MMARNIVATINHLLDVRFLVWSIFRLKVDIFMTIYEKVCIQRGKGYFCYRDNCL